MRSHAISVRLLTNPACQVQVNGSRIHQIQETPAQNELPGACRAHVITSALRGLQRQNRRLGTQAEHGRGWRGGASLFACTFLIVVGNRERDDRNLAYAAADRTVYGAHVLTLAM